MADFAPPYSIPVHARHRDTAFDELPKWLQNRITRYAVPSGDLDDEPEQDPVEGEPEQAEEEEVVGVDIDESGDPMPVDAEFPFHKGGGYYVLSNGSIVRGSDDAEEAEGKLK